MTVHQQDGHDLRLEWGRDGVRALGPRCAVLVVVDVLVFTTSVDVALGRGGRVLPLPWHDERAARAAEAAGATLTPSGLTMDGTVVDADRQGGWSLRPSSLVELPAGTFLAIPSPNGATLCTQGAETGATVLAGCLRNASAVAAAAVELAAGRPIGVVPAGERWRDTEDRRLRPSIEDWLGAAAITSAVRAASPSLSPSPESILAITAFRAVAADVPEFVATSVSGRELTEAGLAGDIALASDVDSSTTVPVLDRGVLVGV